MPQGLLHWFLVLAAGLTMSGYGASAQFDPPVLDEGSFSTQLQVGDICHNYAYEFKFPETWDEEYVGSRLIASSVTRIGTQSRIGLRWLDNSDNVIYENQINIGSSEGDVRDVEAAFLSGSGGDIYVFVTYYDMGGKFLYDLFKWDWVTNAVGGTNGPFIIQNAPDYGRISLSMLGMKQFAVCWENAGELWAMVGTCCGMSGQPDIIGPKQITYEEILGTPIKLPDITFAANNDPENGTINLVISFISSTGAGSGNIGDVYVIKNTVGYFVSALSPVFVSAINGGPDPVPAHFTWPVSNTDYYASSKINIAGNLYQGDEERWAVVYNDDDADQKDLMAMYNTGTATTSGINLTDLSGVTTPPLQPINDNPNYFPAVSFDNADYFTAAWYAKSVVSYVGYNYYVNPTFPLLPNYSLVSYEDPLSNSPIPALSSLTLHSQSTMCSYPVDNGTNEVMNYKFVPFTTLGFRPGHDPEEPENSAIIQVSPNPFRNSISLSVPGDMQQDTWLISLRDVTGRICHSVTGDAAVLNRELNSLEVLPAGLYFLQALNQTKTQQYFFKLIKE